MRGAVVLIALHFVAEISASADVSQTTLGQKTESRIVSGWEAQEGQFPYMLYLRGVNMFGEMSSCGASIIHSSWGLTSARCTAQRTSLLIRAGMVNVNRPRVFFETNSYYTHPEYIDVLQPITQPHDISLIQFNRVLAFDNFIQPVRLQRSADRVRDYTGVKMTTSGWGVTWTEGSAVENLNWVNLVGVSNFVCLLMFNSNFLVQSSTICAGPYNVTSQSICSGDSGVPLTTVDFDGTVSQVGIGSFVSHFGCHVGFPGGFIRPGYYHDWIREVTGIDFDWGRSGAPRVSDDAKDSSPNVYEHGNSAW